MIRRAAMPLAGVMMGLQAFNRAAASGDEQAPLATAELVFSAGAAVKRYDWYRERYYLERLVVEEGAIRLERMQRGAPLLNTHNSWDLEAQLGVCEQPRIANGEGTCSVTFSRRQSVAGYVQDVEDRVIRNVSVGYVRHRVEMVPPKAEGDLWEYRVVDWEPLEVSLVPIPADMDSQIRAAGGVEQLRDDNGREVRSFPCEFVELAPQVSTRAVAQLSTQEIRTMTEAERAAEQQRQADEAARTAELQRQQDVARTAERQRAADITALCARHNAAALAGELISGGKTVDEARAQVLEEIARRDAASGGHRNAIETVRDEVETRNAGIGEAIMHRVDGRSQLTDNGKQFRGMSLLELCRDFLEARNVNTRGMERMQLAGQALQYRSGRHSTSDFAHLLANVANKRLRTSYEENPGTYTRWARRAPNAPDFKSMKVVQLGAAPQLLRVNEHGEFKYGAMSDGAETYAVLTYGRIVGFTRQAIVNDDLRGFDRLLTGFGGSAKRLENATVYSQLTDNAALADGTALFHANHANLAGAGAAISATTLGAGRTAMRKQTGLQGEKLNLVPAYVIVPAALEQVAYQFTSNAYVPAAVADINEFRAGGRTALEPVVEPILDDASATAWYMAAMNSQVDTVEYCYLDGAEGPVIESEPGFEVDGISYKCRLDFAAKAIDHRGLYKNAGA
jgi:hypothetical protein